MKILILAALIMLLPGVAMAVPCPALGCGVTGGVSGPSQNREVFSAEMDQLAGDTSTTMSNTVFTQLRLDMSEYADNLGSITVSAGGDLLCNTSGAAMNNLELHLTTSVVHAPAGNDSFIAQFGTCSACISDGYPELSDGDELGFGAIVVGFHNQAVGQPMVLSAVINVFPIDQCIGILAIAVAAGGNGDTLEVVSGTLGVYTSGDNIGLGNTANTQILFNSNGSIAGSAALEFDGSSLLADDIRLEVSQVEGVRFRVTATTPDVLYRLRIQVKKDSSLQTIITMGDQILQVRSAGTAAHRGIVLNDGDDSNGIHLLTPLNLTLTAVWRMAGLLSDDTANVHLHDAKTASQTFTPTEEDIIGGPTYICNSSSGCDMTLPSALTDLVVCMYDNDGTVGLTWGAGAGDTINLPDGTVTAAAGHMDTFSANSVGDFACLMAINGAEWITLGARGTFAATGP